MKQRMKQVYTRLSYALGNSNGSIMLTTLVLMMAVTVVAVGLNTSILNTATDTYDQYYETQSYYTARSVAHSIAEEIKAQSIAERVTISDNADNDMYASAEEVIAIAPLLVALETLRNGATEVTLDDISFDSASFIEGTDDYIEAKITKQTDTTYLLTATCEISGMSDSVSIALTSTEHEITIGSDGSSGTGSGAIPGIYADNLDFEKVKKFITDNASGVLIASSSDIEINTSNEVWTLKGTTFMSQGSITIKATSKEFKLDEYNGDCGGLYALGDITLTASGDKITFEKSSAKVQSNGKVTLSGSKEISIPGTITCNTYSKSNNSASVGRVITGQTNTVSVVTRSVPTWTTMSNISYDIVASGTSADSSDLGTYIYVESGATLNIDKESSTHHIYGEEGSTVHFERNVKTFKGTITAGTIDTDTITEFNYYYLAPAGDIVSSSDYISSSSSTATTTEIATYYTYEDYQYVKG